MTNQERFDKLCEEYRIQEIRQTERRKRLHLLKIKIIAGYGNKKEKEESADDILLKHNL